MKFFCFVSFWEEGGGGALSPHCPTPPHQSSSSAQRLVFFKSSMSCRQLSTERDVKFVPSCLHSLSRQHLHKVKENGKKAKKCLFFLFSPPEHSSPFSANEVDVTKRWSSTHSDCAKWNRGVCLENTQSGIPVRRPKDANIHLKRI